MNSENHNKYYHSRISEETSFYFNHLNYIWDHTKAMDNKALLVITLLGAFIAYYFPKIESLFKSLDSIALRKGCLLVIIILSLVYAIYSFFMIIFPRTKAKKFIATDSLSTIFWDDIARFPDIKTFKKEYKQKSIDEELLKQIFIISRVNARKNKYLQRLIISTFVTVIFGIFLALI